MMKPFIYAAAANLALALALVVAPALSDDKALARLLERAARDPKYYRRLKDAVVTRRPFFAPSAEGGAVRRLVRESNVAERTRKRTD